MTEIRSEAVDEKEVREALTRMAELWEDLPTLEKKRFASLLVYQVQVSEREVKIGFHGHPPTLSHCRKQKLRARKNRARRPVSGSPTVTDFVTIAGSQPEWWLRLPVGVSRC